jgi:signal transduction histidine kinase
VSYDVTQQKRTAEALQKHADLLEAETAERKEAELRLASIINSTEDMVWSIDAHSLRLLVFNEALAANLKQRWGVTIKRGMAPEDKLPAAVARKWRGYYEQTIRDGAFQIEYALEDLGKLFEMTFHAIRHAGAVVGISVFAKDITKRKRAEMALRVLNQTLELEVAGRTKELQAALVRAEAADRIKSAFLATMSHELRTPLNSIIGFTGIVLQGLAGPLNAEQTKQLGMVRSSSRHLLELINDVLDLSKIEAGQMEIRAQPFDLRESLDRVIASVRPQAAKKGLALSIVAPPDLGQLNSDQRRLEQLLLNLVNNGIKFTESGSVTLTAEIIAPPVAASPASSDIVLRITDTGVGIKPEDLPLLFQPFRQIDTGTARQHEGTGLGLAICRRIAALLGGEIRVASAWGQGSEFIVTLPRHETIATHETHHSANRG